ncbi:MAG TPA: LacI family DNA-binding transcriptional regulator [Candidatus Limnocylindria bacterium]|nr:LacI family DNA-binding transcriptional regulator [Candidatus Limnocylindria bacterium]
MYEVAREAGVSIATVSRVQRGIGRVSPSTRDRVRAVVDALGYRPSRIGRSLARGRHDATGIVFPDLTGPYYSSVILGYEDASAADGQSVLILATHGRHASAMQVLDLADRVDGLVLFGRTVDDDVVAELHDRGVPTVLLARPATGDADTVHAENASSAEALTAHLIGHGHERIAFIGDPEASPDADERWEGFLAAHATAGLAPWREPVPSAFREAAGREAAATLLRGSPRPTAIVCANDEIAIGAMDAARTAGIRLPDDLALTGWDDIPVARHLTPALTTVRQPMHELGRRAAELLRERITTTRLQPRRETLPTELVIRSSCGCPHTQEEATRT